MEGDRLKAQNHKSKELACTTERSGCSLRGSPASCFRRSSLTKRCDAQWLLDLLRVRERTSLGSVEFAMLACAASDTL